MRVCSQADLLTAVAPLLLRMMTLVGKNENPFATKGLSLRTKTLTTSCEVLANETCVYSSAGPGM